MNSCNENYPFLPSVKHHGCDNHDYHHNDGCNDCCCHHDYIPKNPPYPVDCKMVENSFILANAKPYLFDNTHMRYSHPVNVSEQVITSISRRHDDSHINLYGSINITQDIISNSLLNHSIEQILTKNYRENHNVVPVIKAAIKFVLYFHVEDINGGIVFSSQHEYRAKDGFMHHTDINDYLVSSFKASFCHNIPNMTYSGPYTFVIDSINVIADCIDVHRHMHDDKINVFYQFKDNNTKINIETENVRNTECDYTVLLGSTDINYRTIFTANITNRFTLTTTVFLNNISSTPNTFNIWEALNNPTQITVDELLKRVHHLEHCVGHLVHKNAYDSIKPITDEPYLYDVTYSNIDYRFGKEFIKHKFVDTIGGCSSIRKGNFFGRNFDWYYDESAYFITRVGRSIATKYASIGISGGLTTLTKEIVDTNEFNELFGVLPFLITDGINECGVVASLNVVPTGDKGITTGTIPTEETRDVICVLMLVRYVLDKFATAEEAVDYLKKYVSFYAPNKTDGFQQELHAMIADKDKTYLIEFINNAMVVSDMDITYGGRTFMTNFYLKNTALNESDGHINFASVTDFGCGLERYNYIIDHFDSINSVETMTDVMIGLKYTKTYNSLTVPFWKTEYVARPNYTINTPLQVYQPVINKYIDIFNHRKRDGQTWQTCHTAVYDFENKVMYLLCQEEDKSKQKKISFEHTFTEADFEELVSLREKVNEQEQLISTLQSDVSSLDTRVTELENK